ncbi:hypothetical protein [Achromobacter insolitus]|uniref:hypothetical protein n=1 Tax=Achromobacter insolitus TaxID=217204 RepID=UPI001EEE4854|nr:hypothetical protein [Achromobacter insolitus]
MGVHLALAPALPAALQSNAACLAESTTDSIFVDVVKAVPSAFHPPRILTHDLVGRLNTSNAVARDLRNRGYRVMDIDIMPDDGGSPILLVDLVGHSLSAFLDLCDASTSRPGSGRVTALYQGSRIVLDA